MLWQWMTTCEIPCYLLIKSHSQWISKHSLPARKLGHSTWKHDKCLQTLVLSLWKTTNDNWARVRIPSQQQAWQQSRKWASTFLIKNMKWKEGSGRTGKGLGEGYTITNFQTSLLNLSRNSHYLETKYSLEPISYSNRCNWTRRDSLGKTQKYRRQKPNNTPDMTAK